ncbi:MAG: cytidine deaminase [Bacteroidetes bacterium]|nr:MAG: cytidine deaminase [Bacteroidota bacterium]
MEELSKKDQDILTIAISEAEGAYAPYSDFHVGAAIRLSNNTIIKGSNQENAAYPSGLCAERVAIFAASANYPNQEVETIAVYAKDSKRSNHVISPCGSCRQVISEYEHKQNKPIRILLMNSEKVVWEFKDIESLLPFSFKLKALN